MKASTVILLFATLAVAHAQEPTFVHTNGPHTSTVHRVATDSSGAVYAATLDGVYALAPGSERWERWTRSGETFIANDLAVDPAGVLHAITDAGTYALTPGERRGVGDDGEGSRLSFDASGRLLRGSWFSGLFELGDDGASWSLVMAIATASDIATTSNGVTLVAVPGVGIHYRLPGESRWLLTRSGLTCPDITTARSIGAGPYLCGTRCGLFRTDTLGRPWRRVDGELAERTILSLDSRGDTIIGGTDGFAMYRSTDHGATWRQVYEGLENPRVNAVVATKRGWICGTDQGAHVSTDGGVHWRELNDGLGRADVRGLAVDSDGNVFATTQSGVFRSTDRGDSWRHVNHLLTDRETQAITIDDQGRLWVGTRNGRLFRSSSDGDAWEALHVSNTTAPIVAIAAGADGNIFAGTRAADAVTAGSVYRSSDDGATWTRLATMEVGGMVVGSSGDLVVARNDGAGIAVLRASDGRWINRPMAARFHAIVRRGGRYYATTYDRWLYMSSDAARWDSSPWSNGSYPALAADSAGGVLLGADFVVARTTDDGASFTTHRGGLTASSVSTIAVAPDGTVYLGAVDGGVLRQIDAPPASVRSHDREIGIEVAKRDGSLAIELPRVALASVELVDMRGGVVARASFFGARGVVATTGIPDGAYLLRVTVGSTTASVKVAIGD
jgi:photosystem II stability/assembly factor-like uncharacterized protein